MIKDVGGLQGTEGELRTVHNFEYEMERFKITLHTVIKYYQKIEKKELDYITDNEIDRISKEIEEEFLNSEHITRLKSVLNTLKYNEIAEYYIYKRGPKTQHGNIYVVGNDIIKTVYKSEDCGWYSRELKNKVISARRRFKQADKILRGTKRTSVTKGKKKDN